MTTERDLLDALLSLYMPCAGDSLAPLYVCMEHVPLDYDLREFGGGSGQRIADMLVLECSRSSGYALHGFECKVTRSDWLRELNDPSKAAVFTRHCDTWTIVTSGKNIIKPGELPDGWGHLVLQQDGELSEFVKPKRPKGVTRGWSRANKERAYSGTFPRQLAAFMARSSRKTALENIARSSHKITQEDAA